MYCELVPLVPNSSSPLFAKQSPSFCSFLDEVTRIAQAEYVPTDDDILRARLRTLGAQEYRLKFDGGELGFQFDFLPIFPTPSYILPEDRTLTTLTPYSGILNAGMEMGREWAIYDIGGSRTRVSPLCYHHLTNQF